MAQKSRKARSRIYWRDQGGARRAYGDFRDFADVGGKRESLVPHGAAQATTDPLIAETLVAERLTALQLRRRNKNILGVERDAGLIEFAAHHLMEKHRSGRFTVQWLESVQLHLEAAVSFFCNHGRELPRDARTGDPITTGLADRELGSISVGDIQRFTAWLGHRRNGRGATLGASSQRKYLNSLSNLFRRAASESCVPPGYNPVQAMIDKPAGASASREADWLEVPKAALLLECARRYRPERPEMAMSAGMLHAIVATMLLTGGRPSEVLGLERSDVNLERQMITFRPNRWRRLKTASSLRSVRIWPQLAEILAAWLAESPAGGSGLLFESERGGGMVRDIRKALDHVASQAGWQRGEVRPYAFRHTYCAARLQTLDGGQPVSPWTVAREMGHGGRSLVDRVYGHLGEVRHRSSAVEYRVAQLESPSVDPSIPLQLSA